MKISLEVRSETEATFETVKGKGFLSGSQQVRGPDRVTGYTVVLGIEFTEEEKAIVNAYQLQGIVLHDEPLLTSDELKQREEIFCREFRKLDNGPQLAKRELAELAGLRREWHFGDFASYQKSFAAPHDAYVHADFLRAQILPTMKRLLEGYRDRPSKEVFEL